MFPTLTVVFPPKANAAVFVPASPIPYLAVFKSFTSVQLVPFQDSVFPTAVVVNPPKASAAVFVAPHPPTILLAVFNSSKGRMGREYFQL